MICKDSESSVVIFFFSDTVCLFIEMRICSQIDVIIYTGTFEQASRRTQLQWWIKKRSTHGLCSCFKTIHAMENSKWYVHLAAEIFALRMALTKIVNSVRENGSYSIFLDHQGSLLVWNQGRGFPLPREIKSVIHCAKVKILRINFYCVPNQVGIAENKKASTAALLQRRLQ